MKAIRLHASNDLRQVEQLGLESCTGETMVRLKAVGICASDLRWFDDTSDGDLTGDPVKIFCAEWVVELSALQKSLTHTWVCVR